jgi:putative ATP-binding cassette transporter
VGGPFWRSRVRWRAFGILLLLLTFILLLNGLNVVGNFLGGSFTTAVADQKAENALKFALIWAGVFGMLTIVAVFKAFTELRLCLWWRQWLTRHLFDRYLGGRAYHHLKGHAIVDNPDQRMSEDVRTFTEQTLAFLLILTNSIITLVLFAGILWAITPWLLLAAVLYAAFGSITTVFLGRRLVKLDVHQYRKEADLRYDLIQVRTQAESIALLRGEQEEKARLGYRLGSVVDNMKAIIGLSRNIGFFTVGYEYLTQLIPLVVVAPLVISGAREVGILWQAQNAFLLVMGAFSIIVKEFQRISIFGAVIERLGVFLEALATRPEAAKRPIEVVEDESRVAFRELTLVTPGEGRLLIKDLSVDVPSGQRLLVLGPRGSGRTSLLRAAAGLWTSGQGRIIRPPLEHTVFLPQQPYLRHGSLRAQLHYGTRTPAILDQEMLEALTAVGFDAVLERVGGLDAECDWASVLSTGEQQLLAGARLLLARPRFAFLDEPASALDEGKTHQLYGALARTSISYVTAASWPGLRAYHDRVIELKADGDWTAEAVSFVRVNPRPTKPTAHPFEAMSLKPLMKTSGRS